MLKWTYSWTTKDHLLPGLRERKEEKEGRNEIERRNWSNVPPENSTKKGGVEAFRRRESALNLCHCHLVLGGGGEEGEAARGGAEDLVSELGSDLAMMVTVLTLTELSLDWEGKVGVSTRLRTQ